MTTHFINVLWVLNIPKSRQHDQICPFSVLAPPIRFALHHTEIYQLDCCFAKRQGTANTRHFFRIMGDLSQHFHFFLQITAATFPTFPTIAGSYQLSAGSSDKTLHTSVLSSSAVCSNVKQQCTGQLGSKRGDCVPEKC